MEQTTLKYLRILIPGMIFFIGIYPIYNYYFAEVFELKSFDASYLTIICILVGSIYYQINLQIIVTGITRNLIGRNILNKLIGTYGKKLNEVQKTYLKSSKKYLHVFYNLIDNNESLKKKQINVYFNGIFWTSTADLLILSVFFCILYKFVFSAMTNAQEFFDLFFYLVWLSVFLHIVSLVKHIGLSNDQLGFIKIYKKEEVIDQFDKILQQMPKSNNKKGSTSQKHN